MDPVDMAVNKLRKLGHDVERVREFGPMLPSLVYVDGVELTERQALHFADRATGNH